MNAKAKEKKAPEPEDRYCFASHPEEGYGGSFENREAALAEAIVGYDLEAGDEAWTGVIEPIKPETLAKNVGFLIDSILDHLGDEAQELVGEVADSWPPDIQPGGFASEQMDKELQALIVSWIEKYLPYSFHTVNNEQRHVITEEDLAD